MNLSTERRGELFIFFEAALWSLFPIITILSYGHVPPLVSLAWSTLFAAIFFGVVLYAKGKFKEVINKESLKDNLIGTFFLGILYYCFYFFGLNYTSAGNAGIIALSEIFFSYLFFNIWRRQSIPRIHLFGALFAFIGAAIVLSPNFVRFQAGDLLVLAASFVAPIGNFFMLRAREKVSSECIMFVRSIISAPVIFLIAYFFSASVPFGELKSSLAFLIINGVLLLGVSKILWLEGIKRISVVKAGALASISPLLTIAVAWPVLHNTPTLAQLFALAPMSLGVILLSRELRASKK
jgi:drug/metabolite transporter (DMT)-like permease